MKTGEKVIIVRLYNDEDTEKVAQEILNNLESVKFAELGYFNGFGGFVMSKTLKGELD